MHEAALADASERMRTLASDLNTIPCHTYVREGEVWESLSDLIQTHEIDLLVVPHLSQCLDQFLDRPTARKVAARAISSTAGLKRVPK